MSNKKPSEGIVLNLMAQTYKGKSKFIYQAKAYVHLFDYCHFLLLGYH